MKSLFNILTTEHSKGNSDLTAIRVYLSQEGMINNGITLLSELCKKQVNDLGRYKNKAQTTMAFPIDYYQNYDVYTAKMLDTITRKLQLDLPLDGCDIEWGKEFDLTTIKQPFWHDTSEFLMHCHNTDYIPKYTHYKNPEEDK